MIVSGVDIKEVGNVLADVWQGFNFIMHNELYVGIPDKNSSRGEGDGITNAQLMYIMENGSPINRIPPRSVMLPALSDEDTQERIQEYLVSGIRQAFAGRVDRAKQEWEKAGMVAQAKVQDYITSGELEPNAPITIHGGWMRNHVSGKPVYIKGKGSSQPLIDTGSLRKAITYVIKEV